MKKILFSSGFILALLIGFLSFVFFKDPFVTFKIMIPGGIICFFVSRIVLRLEQIGKGLMWGFVTGIFIWGSFIIWALFHVSR